MQVCESMTCEWESIHVLAPTLKFVPLYFPASDGKWTAEYTWVRTIDFVWMTFPCPKEIA
jgi:hypothetical protein